MSTKLCKNCSVEKDVSLFNKRSASKDGLDNMCRACKSEYKMTQHEKHKDRINEKMRAKRLENPEKYKEQSKQNYQRNKTQRLGYTHEWNSKNPELVKQYKTKNQIKNKDKYKKTALDRYHTEEGKRLHNARVEKYSKTEKGKITNRIKRARRRHIADSTKCDFTSADWENCLEHFENVCAYCGSSECISQDHVIPVTKFGSFTVDNIIPACKSCNSSKGNKDLTSWYKTKPYYTDEKHDKILNYINLHQ